MSDGVFVDGDLPKCRMSYSLDKYLYTKHSANLKDKRGPAPLSKQSRSNTVLSNRNNLSHMWKLKFSSNLIKGLGWDLKHSSAQQALATQYDEKENGGLPLHSESVRQPGSELDDTVKSWKGIMKNFY